MRFELCVTHFSGTQFKIEFYLSDEQKGRSKNDVSFYGMWHVMCDDDNGCSYHRLYTCIQGHPLLSLKYKLYYSPCMECLTNEKSSY